MAKIFVSYSREDKSLTEVIVRLLEDLGHLIWWDEHLPLGVTFSEEIEKQIDQADQVAVFWSKSAVKSDWVRAEATAARRAKKIVPARLDQAKLPLEFSALNTADLSGWVESGQTQELKKFLEALGQVTSQSGVVRISKIPVGFSGSDIADRKARPWSGLLERLNQEMRRLSFD